MEQQLFSIPWILLIIFYHLSRSTISILCFVMLQKKLPKNYLISFKNKFLWWNDGLWDITVISTGCSLLFWILQLSHLLSLKKKIFKTNALAAEIWFCKWCNFYHLLWVKENTDSWKGTINIYLTPSLAHWKFSYTGHISKCEKYFNYHMVLSFQQ